ncbi:hypothetical protein BJ165DRAFT_1407692 [Panaeolus papilionaceus]|nr:hypothetical protein BJ165DRAFT_1407692 [Panaeolus papilionaceus]
MTQAIPKTSTFLNFLRRYEQFIAILLRIGEIEEQIVQLGQRMDSIVAGEEQTRLLLDGLEVEIKRMKTIITSESPLITCFEKHVVRLLNHEMESEKQASERNVSQSENAEESEGRVDEELNVLQRAERLRDTFKQLRSAVHTLMTQHDSQKRAHVIASQALREDKQAMIGNLTARLPDTDKKYKAAVLKSKSSCPMALGFLAGYKFVENWGAVATHRR